jgi:diaminopimelate epimerase
MKKIDFYKLQASGNDFVLVDTRKAKLGDYKKMALNLCRYKFAIGADGLLVIEPSKTADFKMRIINSDGSEAEMCGNGARCVGLWCGKKSARFETRAGMIETKLLSGHTVKARFTDPSNIKTGISVNIFGRTIKVNFINTGVPHAVIFVDSLDCIDVEEIGREIRFHNAFAPAGTNVDFVEVQEKNLIHLRTYERGVEGETLACGTGSVASALIFGLKNDLSGQVKVKNKSGEVTTVSFNRNDKIFSDVWLEGKAFLTFTGKVEV